MIAFDAHRSGLARFGVVGPCAQPVFHELELVFGACGAESGHLFEVQSENELLVGLDECAAGEAASGPVFQQQHDGRAVELFRFERIAVTIAYPPKPDQAGLELANLLPLPTQSPGECLYSEYQMFADGAGVHLPVAKSPGPQTHGVIDFDDIHALARPPVHHAPLVAVCVVSAGLLDLVDVDARRLGQSGVSGSGEEVVLVCGSG